MTTTELAQTAYEAYGATTGHKNYAGLPMPKWSDLPPAIQAAWLAATKAIVASGATPNPVLDGYRAVSPAGTTGIL